MSRLGVVVLLATAVAAGSQDVCTLNKPLHAGALRAVSDLDSIVLHHTAIASLGGSIGTLRIRGLSYHYLIDKDGTILRAVPPRRIAFHAAGANRLSIGISFVGGETPSWSPSRLQWSSATWLIDRLVKRYPKIHYVMGHGDVRDTNAGEPFNVSFDRMIAEVRGAAHVELHHPGADEEPLKDFRATALYLLEHPRTPVRIRHPRRLAFETMTCSEGKVRRIPR